MNTLDFTTYKRDGRKISMVTCYDSSFAKIIDKTNIDTILIGDSCSMVMHGENTTIPAKSNGWRSTHALFATARGNSSSLICRSSPRGAAWTTPLNVLAVFFRRGRTR